MRNFAITGVAGYIAPRHLKAIRDSGCRLLAACDPMDAVGLLDQYSFDVRFFTEFERFDRYLEKLRRGPEAERVHFLSVCSPNYLHDAHCRLGLRIGADVICEKPLVINPWNLDALAEVERETGRRVYTMLQLRVHDRLVALERELGASARTGKRDVILTYVTPRGRWFDISWKGKDDKSGGIPANIGVHFFDLLIWLFGPVEAVKVHLRDRRRAAGFIELQRARVRWFLSVEAADLPAAAPGATMTHRSIAIDGATVDFSAGFEDLHTRVYEDVLAGRGYGIEVARPAIDLVHAVRTAEIVTGGTERHPKLVEGA